MCSNHDIILSILTIFQTLRTPVLVIVALMVIGLSLYPVCPCTLTLTSTLEGT